MTHQQTLLILKSASIKKEANFLGALLGILGGGGLLWWLFNNFKNTGSTGFNNPQAQQQAIINTTGGHVLTSRDQVKTKADIERDEMKAFKEETAGKSVHPQDVQWREDKPYSIDTVFPTAPTDELNNFGTFAGNLESVFNTNSAQDHKNKLSGLNFSLNKYKANNPGVEIPQEIKGMYDYGAQHGSQALGNYISTLDPNRVTAVNQFLNTTPNFLQDAVYSAKYKNPYGKTFTPYAHNPKPEVANTDQVLSNSGFTTGIGAASNLAPKTAPQQVQTDFSNAAKYQGTNAQWGDNVQHGQELDPKTLLPMQNVTPVTQKSGSYFKPRINTGLLN
jgi:hypothetical protein